MPEEEGAPNIPVPPAPETPPVGNEPNEPMGSSAAPGGGEDIVFETPKTGSRVWLWVGIIFVVLIGVLIAAYFVLRFLSQRQATSNPLTTGTTTTTGTTKTVTPGQQRDSTRKSDLASIKNALSLYFNDTGTYPKTTGVDKTNGGASILRTALVPKYISVLPVDPEDPTYYYGYKSEGQTYELTSILEDANDPDATLLGTLVIYKVTP